MSYEENLRSLSLDADASIGIFTGTPGLPGSAAPNGGMQYRFVKLVAKGTVGLCTVGTDPVVGVLQNKPQRPGQSAQVGYEGITNVYTGGTIAVGDLLVPDATGRGVTGAGGRLRALAPAAVGELVPALFVI